MKTQINYEQVKQCREAGMTASAAIETLGMSVGTFYNLLKIDVDFRNAWKGTNEQPGLTESEIRLNAKVLEALRSGANTEEMMVEETGLDAAVVEGVLVKLCRVGSVNRIEGRFGIEYVVNTDRTAPATGAVPVARNAELKAKPVKKVKKVRRPYTRKAETNGHVAPAMALEATNGTKVADIATVLPDPQEAVTKALRCAEVELGYIAVWGKPSPMFEAAQDAIAAAWNTRA